MIYIVYSQWVIIISIFLSADWNQAISLRFILIIELTWKIISVQYLAISVSDIQISLYTQAAELA